MKIWRWKKSKFKKILELVENLSKEVKSFRDTLCDLEDIKEDKKDIEEKENKIITALEAENEFLKERLYKKDIFVENLLAQLLGGASIRNLLGATNETSKEDKTSPAMKKYLERKHKNGGVPLP